MSNLTEPLPDTAEMLQTISRCLTIGSCQSLASHCDRASKEILELRAKVLHLEKISSRIMEEHWKNEMYDKLEANDKHELHENFSTFSKVVQELILCSALSSNPKESTLGNTYLKYGLNPSKPSWIEHLQKEHQLSLRDNLSNLTGASV